MRKHVMAPLALAQIVGLVFALPAAAQEEAAGNQVVVADQGTGGVRGQKVSILRQDADWNSRSAEVWSWVPPDRPEWAGITDAKVRTDPKGRRVVLVSAGAGGVAVIGERSRKVIWSSTVPRGANAHSIELLRDGQIVVAGSGDGRTGRGGALYFFPATDRKTSRYTQKIDFLGAHGVVYNDARLWALGYGSLRQYDIRENSLKEASPRITKFWAGGVSEPVGHGHDLATVHRSGSHEMWITNTHHVYRFDKYNHTKSPQRLTDSRDGVRVKAVGNQNDGTMVQTRPQDTNKGQCPRDFQTPTVSMFDVNGRELPSKTRKGSCFYKARPVVWGYY
ncbi:DUF6528 family protein [Saccharothrix sp. NPDC042600]|uniref:DUF6528 family protein n=1 Tax=Saccharothrix TaxID=2071 RepID=UPI0033E313BE|nr:hypothetical protein GCM10017745_55800 [Saccharothrix mutabilis subsp. capreolus]